jgi:hypothetical protein
MGRRRKRGHRSPLNEVPPVHHGPLQGLSVLDVRVLIMPKKLLAYDVERVGLRPKLTRSL